jgi:hypothetical protein
MLRGHNGQKAASFRNAVQKIDRLEGEKHRL